MFLRSILVGLFIGLSGSVYGLAEKTKHLKVGERYGATQFSFKYDIGFAVDKVECRREDGSEFDWNPERSYGVGNGTRSGTLGREDVYIGAPGTKFYVTWKGLEPKSVRIDFGVPYPLVFHMKRQVRAGLYEDVDVKVDMKYMSVDMGEYRKGIWVIEFNVEEGK